MSDYSPTEFFAEFDVSRETQERLLKYDGYFLSTAERMNLVAKSTLQERWDRHFRDSAQLYGLLPAGAQRLLDIGSGAGFPGLVLAAMGADAGLHVTMVESVGKKAGFLSQAAVEMALENVAVSAERIENIDLFKPDVITARALAALPKLFNYVERFCTPDTLCIFPKGQHVVDELNEAAISWCMDVEHRPSVTSAESSILLVRGLKRK